MTTTSVGRAAENAGVAYLKKRGYKVLHQNWRTRWCEVDIIASKKKVIYFVEVKYRKSADFGGGLDYITPKKLEQMQFAARIWVNENNWSGDYRLSGLEISGPKFQVTSFLPNIA